MITGTAGSNPVECVDVIFYVYVFCAGSSLCDELISHLEESYRLCVRVCVCLIMCDLLTSTIQIWRHRRDLGCCVSGKVIFGLGKLSLTHFCVPLQVLDDVFVLHISNSTVYFTAN
jgi:hypothetical protein